MALQKSFVRSFVENLAQHPEKKSQRLGEYTHAFSSANRVNTKGASFTRASSLPIRTRIHWCIDSIKTSVTITTRPAVTAASSRLLKMSLAVAPVAGPAASACAWAKNPLRGLGSNTLGHDAVKVTETSHPRGMSVTAA